MSPEERDLRARLQAVESVAAAARRLLDDGHVPDALDVLHAAAKAVEAAAKTTAARAMQQERDLARGVFQESGRGRFEVRDGATTRIAEVYPNAHNDGATYGVNVNTYGRGLETWPGGKFMGASWTLSDATVAARAWVRDGVMPEFKRREPGAER